MTKVLVKTLFMILWLVLTSWVFNHTEPVFAAIMVAMLLVYLSYEISKLLKKK